MADNDFKFVTASFFPFSAVWVYLFLLLFFGATRKKTEHGLLHRSLFFPMEISFKGCFDSWVAFVGLFDGRSGCTPSWNVVGRTAFVQIRIRSCSLDPRKVLGNNVGGFFGSCHVGNTNHFNVATGESGAFNALDHFLDSLSGFFGLLSSQGCQNFVLVQFFVLGVLPMANQDDVSGHSFFSYLTFSAAIFVLVPGRVGFQTIPVRVPQRIFYLWFPQLSSWK
mmetsp:Transcript_7605/g.18623  ORF Transcript_7605/g.18623 Transcript_7605/m.18623 type:complete len:223 (+) Transcript_7605:327-995(+)